jgi:hypothetical protein
MLGFSLNGWQASDLIRSRLARIVTADEGDTDLPAHRQFAAVQLLLGHTKIESTVRYLGIEADDALSIAEQVEV